MKTKTWLRLEGAAVFIITLAVVYLISISSAMPAVSWKTYALWFLIFFLPDISMLGYTLGNKIGAVIYNVFHTYIVPLPLLLIVFIFDDVHSIIAFEWIFLWIAHIGFDRMLGYGLKETSGFKDTHLKRM